MPPPARRQARSRLPPISSLRGAQARQHDVQRRRNAGPGRHDSSVTPMYGTSAAARPSRRSPVTTQRVQRGHQSRRHARHHCRNGNGPDLGHHQRRDAARACLDTRTSFMPLRSVRTDREVATGAGDKIARIWDPATRQARPRIRRPQSRSHGGRVQCGWIDPRHGIGGSDNIDCGISPPVNSCSNSEGTPTTSRASHPARRPPRQWVARPDIADMGCSRSGSRPLHHRGAVMAAALNSDRLTRGSQHRPTRMPGSGTPPAER